MEEHNSGTEAAMKIFNQFVFADCLAEEDKTEIIEEAMSFGQRRAQEIRAEFGEITSEQILKNQGILIVEENKKNGWSDDYVKFAEYYTKTSEIRLNMEALKKVGEHMDVQIAREIVLSHELYHYFEYKRWGDTAKLFIRDVKLFGWIPVKRKMLPAAEIAANSFTRQFLGLDFAPQTIEEYYFK